MAWGNDGGIDYQAQNITTAGNGTLTVPNGLTQLGGGLEVTDIGDIGGSEIQVNSVIHFNEAALLEAGGESAGQFTVTDNLDVTGVVNVGPGNAAGKIDAIPGAGPTPMDLELGGQVGTEDVKLGRATKNVESAAAVMDFEGELRIGPTGATGKVDSGGTAGTPRNLDLGTQNVTLDVNIGRAGRIVGTAGGINVSQTAFFGGNTAVGGTLKVGPTAATGNIDSGGVVLSEQDLAIGAGAGTTTVALSRAGQTIDMFGQARMNSNAIIMNAVANIGAANGAGLVYNANGHGGGGIAIDVVINNNVVAWFDAAGIH